MLGEKLLFTNRIGTPIQQRDKLYWRHYTAVDIDAVRKQVNKAIKTTTSLRARRILRRIHDNLIKGEMNFNDAFNAFVELNIHCKPPVQRQKVLAVAPKTPVAVCL